MKVLWLTEFLKTHLEHLLSRLSVKAVSKVGEKKLLFCVRWAHGIEIISENGKLILSKTVLLTVVYKVGINGTNFAEDSTTSQVL